MLKDINEKVGADSKPKGFTEVDVNGKTRIRFDLKPIYEGSHTMIGKANYDVNKTNYVVKLFNL